MDEKIKTLYSSVRVHADKTQGWAVTVNSNKIFRDSN